MPTVSVRQEAPQFQKKTSDDVRLAAICKALGHPHRVYIVRFLLTQRSCFAGEIAEQLPLAASTVSQHLAQLRNAGVIVGEADGPRRSYRVASGVLDEVSVLIDALEGDGLRS